MIRIVEVMILASFSSGTIAAALAHRAFLQSESQGIYSPVSTSVYTTHRVRYCKLGAAAWFFLCHSCGACSAQTPSDWYDLGSGFCCLVCAG